jgi:hypothetical protein
MARQLGDAAPDFEAQTMEGRIRFHDWIGEQRLPPGNSEAVMNEDTFNIQVRKFLKEVGVTSQREIESAVRRVVEAGRLKGDEKLKASARVQIESIGLDHRIEGEIALS